MSFQKITLVALPLVFAILFSSCQPSSPTSQQTPTEPIKRYDRPDASILKGVEVPSGKRLFISSGQVSAPNDLTQPEKTLARYGDTYAQSIGVLKKIEGILKDAGLSLADVVYLGVFIAPDPNKENQIDFDAWFNAYGKFFNNEENPTKVARTTLGVAALARPYLLIEVEAIAVYPEK